jgi:hypothetical protein
MAISHDVDTRPWYRQFWPWFLFGLPAIAVVAGITTVIIATTSFDGLVVDDYYKEGLAINRDLDKDHMATRLGLNADLRFDLAKGTVNVVLDSAVPIPDQGRLDLTLIHPTRANADVHVPLRAGDRPGHYVAQFPPQAHAIRWDLLLSPEHGNWRLLGRYPGGETAHTRLQAQG